MKKTDINNLTRAELEDLQSSIYQALKSKVEPPSKKDLTILNKISKTQTKTVLIEATFELEVESLDDAKENCEIPLDYMVDLTKTIMRVNGKRSSVLENSEVDLYEVGHNLFEKEIKIVNDYNDDRF